MRRVVLLVAVLLLVPPSAALATHEVPDPVPLLLQVSRTIGNNAPVVPVSGILSVDVDAGTWSVGCPFAACTLELAGTLEPDTHVGPADLAACPVHRGYGGTGAFAPPLGTFGFGPYDSAELHDVRLTVTPAGFVLEGAWSDAAGRGDRFAAALATPPLPAGSAQPCHTAGVRTALGTGAAWAVGVVR